MTGHTPHQLRRSVTGYDPDGRPIDIHVFVNAKRQVVLRMGQGRPVALPNTEVASQLGNHVRDAVAVSLRGVTWSDSEN